MPLRTRSPSFLHCRRLGLAGTAVIAGGGTLAGVPPANDPLAHLPGIRELRGWSVLGVLIVYLGLTMLVVAWWRIGGMLRQPDRPSWRDLVVTTAVWGSPFAVIGPIFSGDVYSYLAQGAMTAAGIDAYKWGPAVLGGDLAANVPDIWQHTPTPYGPVFLDLASGITRLTGAATWPGLLGMRTLAVAGLVMIIWSFPYLAESTGVDLGMAAWLGVLNPLILLHLIADAHNEVLMLGMTLVGLVLALRGRPVLGVVMVTLAALIKAPAALAIVFLVAIWAGRYAPWARWIRVALAATAVCVGTAVAVTALAGTGYGWIAALDTPARARTWMSITTDVGSMFGAITQWLGLASMDESRQAMWLVGLAAAGCLFLMLCRYTFELGPVVALGLGLETFVVLGPVVHPWYLLWGIVPLAVATTFVPIRRAIAVGSVALTLSVLPGGVQPGLPALAGASLGLLVVLVAVVLLTDFDRRHLWAPLAAPPTRRPVPAQAAASLAGSPSGGSAIGVSNTATG